MSIVNTTLSSKMEPCKRNTFCGTLRRSRQRCPQKRELTVVLFVVKLKLFSTFQIPGEEPSNPKFVHNLKARVAGPKENIVAGLPECEGLVQQMRKDKCNIQSVVLLPEHYVSFNATDQMLKDVGRFCIDENSVFRWTLHLNCRRGYG